MTPSATVTPFRPLRIAVALVGLLLFAWMAADVTLHGPCKQADLQFASWLKAHRPNESLAWVAGITHAGSFPVVATATAIVGLWLILSRRWVHLAGWAVGLAGAGVITPLLKNLFRIPRPSATSAYGLTANTFTFPSGHSFAALTWLALAAYLIAHAAPRYRRPAWIAATTAIALVAAALVYIGVHYVTDVVAALGLAAAWVTVCVVGMEAVHARPEEHNRPRSAGFPVEPRKE